MHPWAHGPDGDEASLSDDWFHELFDCYSINPHPNWGSFDPAIRDDPSLDRDDNDGAGPENISLDWPEQGMTYRVGVHYWNDHGYGRSYATVRVYLYSSLIFERPDVLLHNKDMWEVCTIHWPSGKVLPVTGENDSHQIIPDYPLPPWSPSGDRSEEP